MSHRTTIAKLVSDNREQHRQTHIKKRKGGGGGGGGGGGNHCVYFFGKVA